VSRLHGRACQRQCDSIAAKLSRLDACEDWKVVRWCRTQESSHNSQSVVDGGVDKAGMSTAAPDRCAELYRIPQLCRCWRGAQFDEIGQIGLKPALITS